MASIKFWWVVLVMMMMMAMMMIMLGLVLVVDLMHGEGLDEYLVAI